VYTLITSAILRSTAAAAAAAVARARARGGSTASFRARDQADPLSTQTALRRFADPT